MGEMTEITRLICEKFEEVGNIWDVAEYLRISPEVVRRRLRISGYKLPKGSYSRRTPVQRSGSPGLSSLSEVHLKIGAKITYMRISAGFLEAKDFAEYIGMSTRKLGQIERGQTDPSVGDLMLIAKGLGVSVSELVQPLDVEINRRKEEVKEEGIVDGEEEI